MKVGKYGISLERLSTSKIEMLRQWRNAPHIANTMLFQEEITTEQQKSWFSKVNNHLNFYFIISYKNTDIGMIHCIDIDWEKRTGFAGLFIHEQGLWNTHIPVLASLALLDVCFYLFGLEEISAIVRKDNDEAVLYNSQLGFHIAKEHYTENSLLMTVTENNFSERSQKLRRIAQKLSGNDWTLSFTSDNYPGKDLMVKTIKENIHKSNLPVNVT